MTLPSEMFRKLGIIVKSSSYQLNKRFVGSIGSIGEKVGYPGAVDSVFCDSMQFVSEYSVIPTYRVLSTKGTIIQPSEDPKV